MLEAQSRRPNPAPIRPVFPKQIVEAFIRFFRRGDAILIPERFLFPVASLPKGSTLAKEYRKAQELGQDPKTHWMRLIGEAVIALTWNCEESGLAASLFSLRGEFISEVD